MINSILHPKVKKKIELVIKEYFRQHSLVFTEAALIYEAEMESMFDYVILITAEYDVRKERALASGKITEQDFDQRNKNQIKDEEKKKRADFIFDNNGSEKDSEQKVRSIN
jgi:dephospho-CoA kinase